MTNNPALTVKPFNIRDLFHHIKKRRNNSKKKDSKLKNVGKDARNLKEDGLEERSDETERVTFVFDGLQRSIEDVRDEPEAVTPFDRKICPVEEECIVKEKYKNIKSFHEEDLNGNTIETGKVTPVDSTTRDKQKREGDNTTTNNSLIESNEKNGFDTCIESKEKPNVLQKNFNSTVTKDNSKRDISNPKKQDAVFNMCGVLDFLKPLKSSSATREVPKIDMKDIETKTDLIDNGTTAIAPSPTGKQKVCDFLNRIGSFGSINESTVAHDSKMIVIGPCQKEYEAREIAKSATFEEFLVGYYHSTKWVRGWNGQYSVGRKKKQWFDMKKPHPCTNMKVMKEFTVWRWMKGSNIRQIHPISWYEKAFNPTAPPPRAEMRGITLRQLRAVIANVRRRCSQEKWVNYKGKVLLPEQVSLYEVDKYIIRPFTVERKESFVSCLPSTAGPQPPRFFVNHWWGGPVIDFVECIEQLVRDFGANFSKEDAARGGGMTIDTPIWICGYAMNQWNVGQAFAAIPKESAFLRPMAMTQGRTITILDKNGTFFSRTWCMYELSLDPSERNLWAVYTAKKHKHKNQMDEEEERDALGMIPGGAPSDMDLSTVTKERESAFPYELIAKAFDARIEETEASIEIDRVNILNAIAGNIGDLINNTPAESHVEYTVLNDIVRAKFASSQTILQTAAKRDDEDWNAILIALSKGKIQGQAEFDFKSDGWIGLTAARATQLVAHIPLTIGKLSIINAQFGFEFMEALLQRIHSLKDLQYLKLTDTLVGDEEAGQDAGKLLADTFASNTTIKRLELLRTDLIGPNNVVAWEDALTQNRTLTTLTLLGVEAEVESKLRGKINTPPRGSNY